VAVAGLDDCWEWTASVNKNYGVFWLDGKNVKAHRVAYELSKGPIAPDNKILHSCDNPICCNPNHLSQGSDQDNSDDMVAKGRSAKGERVAASFLTEDQVKFIKSSNKGPTELAAMFMATRSTVSKVKLGRTWRHI